MIPLPPLKTQVGVIDWPWYYRDEQTNRPGKQYDTLKMPESLQLAAKLKESFADDAILYFWTTGPHFFDSEPILWALGFGFVTVAFDWLKLNKGDPWGSWFMGMGSITRANSEYLLAARRGQGIKVYDHSIKSVQTAPVQEMHSQKPRKFQELIEQLHGPGLVYTEYFAREPFNGWQSWGDQLVS